MRENVMPNQLGKQMHEVREGRFIRRRRGFIWKQNQEELKKWQTMNSGQQSEMPT